MRRRAFGLAPGILPHTPESRRGACRAPLCHAYSSVHLRRFVQPRVGDLQPISSFGMSPRAHMRERRQRHAAARAHVPVAKPYYAESGTLRHPTAAGTDVRCNPETDGFADRAWHAESGTRHGAGQDPPRAETGTHQRCANGDGCCQRR
ncbi:hypothetical protein CBM2587_B90751 [Cupriavidus taiwanensis]|uniref:Uncharacterized protein n=1 Tax=Cupriavidus taiwanensis TaxID=164546 RepID=A0A976A8M0_9BURK|nr:hypothetical protein CBM2587_B90751 [Cupriavidus taiwanensis]